MLIFRGPAWRNGKITALWPEGHKFESRNKLYACGGKAMYVYTP